MTKHVSRELSSCQSKVLLWPSSVLHWSTGQPTASNAGILRRPDHSGVRPSSVVSGLRWGKHSRLDLTPVTGGSLSGQVGQRAVAGGLVLSVRHLVDCSWRQGVQPGSIDVGWLRERSIFLRDPALQGNASKFPRAGRRNQWVVGVEKNPGGGRARQNHGKTRRAHCLPNLG